MASNILQAEVLTDFLYPFLLVFFIVFALLEKIQVFGDNKKQVHAMIAFVIGLMFVAAVDTQLLVGNLVLFLAVGVVLVFVILLLWGFLIGDTPKFNSGDGKGPIKWIVGIIVILAVVIFLFIVTGVHEEVYDFFFDSSWSGDVWTNIIFVVIIAAALAIVIKGGKAAGGDGK